MSDAKQISALIEDNIDLVNHVVYQVAMHFPRHVEREELARAGSLGLVEAARRYDESKGVPFRRFAALPISISRPIGRSSMRCARPTGRRVRFARWLVASTLPNSGSRRIWDASPIAPSSPRR